MTRVSSRASRVTVAVAMTGAVGLVLAGCASGDNGATGNTGGEGKDGGTISIAVTNAVTSFNGDTPQGNLDSNGMVGYLTGVSGSLGLGSFITLDPEFNIIHEEGFGTVEQLSEDPLQVKYTLKDGLKWSDGEPITADDMLFAWAQGSGWFDDATLDPETGEPTSGTQYFSLAGSTTGLDMTAFPEIGDDNLSMTLTYEQPFVDWDSVNPIGKPAHIMAKQADLSVDELTKLITDTPKGDPAKPAAAPIPELKKIADFWNSAYDTTTLPENKDLLVASGPFVVSDFVPEQSLTLSKNPEYQGDHEVAYDNLVFRFIGDSNAQITALQNGEVDAIYPQPSADTNAALDKMGATLYAGDQMAYDHLDLNMGGETFKDAKVREAFMKTVPRQQILDSIITPMNPDAEVLNSQIWVSANPEYANTIKENGYDAFTEPDIEGAKKLLGGATPTVKILYNNENPNRVDTFQLVKASAEEAGFVVEDMGDPNWGALLSGGEYDASIFGWVSPGIGNSALPQIFKTGGGGNYNGFSNAEADKLVDETQVSLDPAELEKQKIRIDTITAEQFYGLPLFQTPGLFADNGSISGVEYFGGQTGIVWNAQDWTLN